MPEGIIVGLSIKKREELFFNVADAIEAAFYHA
jgi:hypothetical protein